jgi:hypothetical protein
MKAFLAKIALPCNIERVLNNLQKGIKLGKDFKNTSHELKANVFLTEHFSLDLGY